MKHTTTNFYVPPNEIQNGRVSFPKDESNHLSRVLRAETGDIVRIIDGVGNAYEVEIVRSDPDYSRGKILKGIDSAPEPSLRYTLAVGTINPRRLESAWDSCVQLGISSLIPMWTSFSTDRLRPDGKYIDRLHTVSKRAMKQSGRAVLPEVQEPVSLVELLKRGRFEYIFYGEPDGLPNPPQKTTLLSHSVLLMIGPEGGFSSEEIRLLEDCSAIPISLGPRRLRSETAMIVLSIIALRWSGDI